MYQVTKQKETYWIYGLFKNEFPNDICYVGVTCRPEKRLKQHVSIRREKFSLRILDTFEAFDWKSALEVERHWICLCKKRGHVLLNKDVRFIPNVISSLSEYGLISRIEKLKQVIKSPTCDIYSEIYGYNGIQIPNL